MNRRARLSLLIAVGVVALGGTAIAAPGSGPHRAPVARDLGIAPPLRVVTAAAGPSDVDSALPERYQYMILGALSPLTPSALVKREVRFLLAHGWTDAQATKLITTAKTGTVRIHLVAIGTPGSVVELNDRHDRIYAAIDMISGPAAAVALADGTPLATKPIARALAHHDHLLNVVLGNGSFKKAHEGEIFASGY